MLRYGDALAYIPHYINLDVVVETSDGSTPIIYRLWVTDLVGQNVTAGQILCHCPIDDTSSTHVSLHSFGACHIQPILFVVDWA